MTDIVWPKHACELSLTHNRNRSYYQTVEEMVRDDNLGDWVSDEQRQKAIDTNEIWELQWYPDTPIGFCCLWAADLDVLLAAAQEDDAHA